jgi:ring-1,2-phenylacetyl-CoA epoxidase subunit PaaD
LEQEPLEQVVQKMNNSEKLVWKLLEDVKDPEIPVVSVVEMGLIRQVEVQEQEVHIRMTLTYSGCPALYAMQDEIKNRLQAAGFKDIEISISHDPAWTSDWIQPQARRKLKAFGLAPPPVHGGKFELALLDNVVCPYCGSSDTELKNSFGPTLCRSIFYCNNCQQPFEQFKPI